MVHARDVSSFNRQKYILLFLETLYERFNNINITTESIAKLLSLVTFSQIKKTYVLFKSIA